jgi:hypothetical protein
LTLLMANREDGRYSAMDEIEAFLDECRADPWFQSHPEVVDRLEGVLTNFYLSGEGPEWQVIWDQVVPEKSSETPVDRCQALAARGGPGRIPPKRLKTMISVPWQSRPTKNAARFGFYPAAWTGALKRRSCSRVSRSVNSLNSRLRDWSRQSAPGFGGGRHCVWMKITEAGRKAIAE